MRDIAMFMMLPLTMILGWILLEGSTDEVVISIDDCISQKRDTWRENNHYPGHAEWRRFRDQCWSELGATVNDVADL